MEENNAIDFVNLINLKGQLINFDERKLIDLYTEDYYSYVVFLNAVGLLINNELAFLFLNDDYIEKISAVVHLHRFSTDDSEVKDLVNQIIVAINQIKKMSEEEKFNLKYEYLLDQENMRCTSFRTEEDFLYSLNFDSFLAHILKNDETELLSQCDNDYTLMSLYYAMALCPEFFDDPTVEKNTIEKLDSMAGKFGRRRARIGIYADDLVKKIHKVLKREE